MPVTVLTPVKKLKLDLLNFRTVPQSDEIHAVQVMIATRRDRFLALLDSLMDQGYLPTENILVLKGSQEEPGLVVKEGNRRIAALKLLYGYLPSEEVDLPENVLARMAKLSLQWKSANRKIPCVIFDTNEASTVNRAVSLAHGYSQKAAKDQWNSVARARHHREVAGANEPALDLLEKYLKSGKNMTAEQAERWSGDYRLTVLDEAVKKVAGCFDVASAAELAKKYPKIKHRSKLDLVLRDIGLEIVGFREVRSDTFTANYKLLLPQSSGVSTTTATSGTSVASAKASPAGQAKSNKLSPKPKGGPVAAQSGKKGITATPSNDPKTVRALLKNFKPLGNGREKIVALKNEAAALDIKKTPMAFCFLLRSMFELSAKAYCSDYKEKGGPSYTKPKGGDRKLSDVLVRIKSHLSNNESDNEMLKSLHGAITELARPEGILSVTSMNQLVHNPNFTVDPAAVSTLFTNIFPLLKAMNR